MRSKKQKGEGGKEERLETKGQGTKGQSYRPPIPQGVSISAKRDNLDDSREGMGM